MQDLRYFTCVANLVWLPTSLKGFTDTLPEIKAPLRVCSFHLYGWVCEHEGVQAQAEQIRAGWMPVDYPQSCPSPEQPDVLPPGTAPFTDRIEREVARRKDRVRADLANADLLHYPRNEVEAVLKFWKIDLF